MPRGSTADGHPEGKESRAASRHGDHSKAEAEETHPARRGAIRTPPYSLEETDIRQKLTRESVNDLGHQFSEKVLDLVPDVPTEYEDPLGIYTADNTKAPSKPKAPVRRRGRRKVQENIFRDFGKEHDKSALHEIEVGGIIITRANFKRFWQCDRELSRWRQDLNDNTRNDKLLDEVRSRWHPDFRGDRAELLAKHTTLARQRSEAMERGGVMQLRRSSTSVEQLKDMQTRLKPKEHTRRTGKRFLLDVDSTFGARIEQSEASRLAGALSMPSSSSGPRQRPQSATNQAEESVFKLLNYLMRQCSTLEEAFHMIDRNNNNILSMAEFATSLNELGFPDELKFLYRILEKDNDGYISLNEFMNLKPYLLKGLEMHRVTVRAPGGAPTSSRLSGDTAQQADFDVSCELGSAKDSLHDRRLAARSDGSGPISRPESPGSGRRRLSRDTDASGTECVTDVKSDGMETSPRSIPRDAGGASKRPPPPDGPLPGSHTPAAPPQSQLRGPRLPQMPLTLSLLLFRNADKLHAGEAVFVNRWPLPSLRDLLNICSKACRPVVGPAEALLNADLTPVRSCEEVRNGSVYLLKGHEGLDPPPLFFTHWETQHLSASQSAPSLRKLTSAKDAIAADQEIRRAPSPVELQMTSQSRGGSSWLLSQAHSLPTAGSPPWPSQGLPPTPQKIGKWQVHSKLGMVMMWGGLGQLPRHPEYHTWQPALRPHGGSSRGSLERGSSERGSVDKGSVGRSSRMTC